mgnify:CR=1 FL=1
MIVSYFYARKEKVPKSDEEFSIKNVFKAFIHSFWALTMFVVVIGGLVAEL